MGVEQYEWIRAYLGAPGLDWLVGAWAVIAAELTEFALLEKPTAMELEPEVDDPLLVEVDGQSTAERPPTPESFVVPAELPHKKALLYLASILLAGTLPSFTSPLPAPPYSDQTTPFSVACVLPPPATKGSELDRYITETKKHAARAKVLLWPEGAVSFDNESERESAFAQVINVTKQYGAYIGVTFDEVVSSDEGGRTGKRRIGMALVGPDGNIDIEYYKRHLVPREHFSCNCTSFSHVLISIIVRTSGRIVFQRPFKK